MTPANTWTLLTLVDSADAEGRICLLAQHHEPIRTNEQAREWLETIFMDTSMVTLRLEKVKKAITEIDLQLHETEHGTALVLNLAKLLQLPAAAPAAELAEFREMLVEMKAFFEAHPQERCDIQLANNRDDHRRVYGSVCCRVPAGENKMQADETATAALTARIDASPALTHWLKHLALSLQKIGPWSWSTIREDALFGDREGPYATWLRTQPRPTVEHRLTAKLEYFDF
ncbi:hypothetical protein WJ97_12685 [Burkholderia ubonensis]|uniref:hypothetical protein n=1 Tax=Burkholderia ubonensis TaxID=101571 RepID=UPI000758FF03|nr:hypothetical protein [Burkholderia ubonensis]KVP96730.1 hypothetical protein WJ97_12685 [Burkholderia ubonensis]